MQTDPNRPKLRYLSIDKDRHGNVRRYVRKSGKPKVRLYAEPFDSCGALTKDFMKEYWAALEGNTSAASGNTTDLTPNTFNWLVHQYYNSARFLSFDVATQRDKRSVLGRFCESAGRLPYKNFRQEDVERSQMKRWETPGAADKLVKYLKALFNWAIDKKLAEYNPAQGVKRINTDGEGWYTWSVEDIESYRRHWPLGTKQRLALELILYTGGRRSDVVRLGRQLETADGNLSWIEAKNRKSKPKRTTIPMLPELRTVIKGSPTGDLTYLISERGTPYKKDSFGNEFKTWCTAAGLSHCSAHGLRKAAAVALAERGATAPQLCAIFGWRKLETAQIYIQKADKHKLASDGLKLLSSEQTKGEIVPLSGAFSGRGTKRSKNGGTSTT